MEAATIEKPKNKVQKYTNEQRVQLAETVRRDWVHTMEVGTTLEDLKDPDYWALVAVKFVRFDRVEARMETGEWLAEMVVTHCDRTWARMHVLKVHEFGKTEEPSSGTGKYRVEYKGLHRKFSVIRNADSAVIKEGFSEKLDAANWMAQHERTTG
jgi:hypothetical protein